MEIFAELSIIIVIAAVVAGFMRVLRQPLIVGHILTGLIVGPFVLNLIHSTETIALLGNIGVAILLFTVGIHLSPDILRKFGRVSVITGVGQVLFTTIAGYVICILLGYSPLESFYIGVALAFSSTIIIMKLISDKGDMEVLYAKIAIGFLLVQDLIAVLLLLGVPLFTSGNLTPLVVASFVGRGVLLITVVMLASRFFISRVSGFLGKSQEFLFLFSLAWGVGIAALFHQLGFSLESGALIAGVALATLPSRHEIGARLLPLRDFFIVMFFIFLGSQMQLVDLGAVLPIALGLSVLVLIGNPLILMVIMGVLGYKKKTSLQTGFTVAQISEFSLILIALGVSLGHLSDSILSLVTLVGLITIFGSSYLVLYSDRIYKALAPYLGIFERKGAHESSRRHTGPEIMLIGCNRIGHDFLLSLKDLGRSYMIVDYDPETITRLSAEGVATAYGDASDFDFIDDLDYSKVELVISTVPDAETSAMINRVVRSHKSDAVVMVVAHRMLDAIEHYGEGVDYVILPHFLGAKHAAEIVVKFQGDKDKYDALRDKHLNELKLRIDSGHEHPTNRG